MSFVVKAFPPHIMMDCLLHSVHRISLAFVGPLCTVRGFQRIKWLPQHMPLIIV